MFTGANIVVDGLVFGYDTGYPLVSDNLDTYKFNKGEPAENHIPNVGTSIANWSEYGWSGDFVTGSDFSNTFELTSTNGWHNATFDHGQSSGTVNISFDYKLKSQETSGIYGFVLNGTHLGSYTNYIKTLNDADVPTFQWKTFSETYTGNADTKLAIGLRGTDNGGLSDTLYIKNLQVEVNSHRTPFINGTRSVSGSLIDLTRTNDIDLSNVSFNSDAQMTFNGTDDYFTTSGLSVGTPSTLSFETVIKFDGTLDSNDRKVFHWDKTSTTNAVAQIRKGTNNGRLMYQHHNSQWYTLAVDDVVVADTYTHIVVTHEDTTAIMYKDGVQVGTTTVGTLDYTNAGEILMGYRANAEYWKGEIPLFRVYNRKLTASEVKQNYNAIKPRFNL